MLLIKQDGGFIVTYSSERPWVRVSYLHWPALWQDRSEERRAYGLEWRGQLQRFLRFTIVLIGGVTWGCPENVHDSAFTTEKNGGGHVLPLTKPAKSALPSRIFVPGGQIPGLKYHFKG